MSESFRTSIKVQSTPMIDHQSKIITMGSCFSDNIGEKLAASKIETLVNPFGTTYNPMSIQYGLLAAINRLKPESDMFTESDGLSKHFFFHSRYAANTREALEEKLNKLINDVGTFLAGADVVMITYGTSWVWRHKATGRITANCHKRPATEFEKELVTQESIVTNFKMFHILLKKAFPKLKFILTLSPVRHVRDTIELNQVGKSILRSSIYEITRKFEDVFYFPAYEIMMDDLRDYRFYAADMIHPSEVAIEYIWEKFGESYFSKETREMNEKYVKELMRSRHRPNIKR